MPGSRSGGLFSLFLFAVSTLAAQDVTTSARPVTAVIQDLGIGGRKQVTINVSKNDGQLQLTHVDADFKVCVQRVGDEAPPVVFYNDSDFALRITLRQPYDSPDGSDDTKCKPSCSLDDDRYKNLCKPQGQFCDPEPGLAYCGTPDCFALRSVCDGSDCKIDYYRALESCGCSVTKVVFPSPNNVKDSNLPVMTQFQSDIAGQNLSVWVSGFSALGRKETQEYERRLSERFNTHAKIVGEAAAQRSATNAAVIFDSSLFPRSNDPITFIIEANVKPPTPQVIAVRYPRPLVVTMSLVKNTAGCLVPTPGKTRMHVAVVPLDNTGVASWRYLNPRNPACIDCEEGGKSIKDPSRAPVGLAFHNRTPDRTFTVSIALPAGAKLSQADEAAFKCKPGKACTISRNVPPQASVLFDRSILTAVDPKTVQRFDVTLAAEVGTLGNGHAYVSLAPAFDEKGTPQLKESDSGTQLKTKFSLAGRIDPDLPDAPDKDHPPAQPCVAPFDPDLEPALCHDRPYTGGEVQQYKGSGSVQLMPNLGDRANGSATLSFRNGSFGTAIDKVALSEYQVNIYGVDALSLKFGKTDFATPSNGLAISESGEGFLFSFLNVSLGHVVARESATGKADRRNNDKKDWFIQARSITFSSTDQEDGERHRRFRYVPRIRSLDLIAMRGEDKGTSKYQTAGGEMFFAAAGTASESTNDVSNLFGGSLAGYHSWIHRSCPPTTSTCNNGRGTVGLLSMTWIPTLASTPQGVQTPQTFTVYFGLGSGDRPKTDLNEGYIGETASYTPDKLFLSSLLGKLNAKKKNYFDPGLSNKRYLAVTYTNTTSSMLELIANALRVHNDVISRSTTVWARQYRLVHPRTDVSVIPDHLAAREADITFQIEVPKGVTWSLDGAYVEAGGALKDIFKTHVWSISSSVTLSL